MLSVVCAICSLFNGCGGEKTASDPSQVVIVQVGQQRFTSAEIQNAQGRVVGDSNTAQRTLMRESLVMDEALKAGWHLKPEVRAQISASTRQVISQTYVEHLMSEATTEVAVKAAYRARKADFGHQEMQIRRISVFFNPDLYKKNATAAKKEAFGRAQSVYALIKEGWNEKALASMSNVPHVKIQRQGQPVLIKSSLTDADFYTRLSKLTPNVVSAPIEHRFGYHLIEVVEPSRQIVPEFDQIEGRIRAQLRQEAHSNLITRLEDKMPSGSESAARRPPASQDGVTKTGQGHDL